MGLLRPVGVDIATILLRTKKSKLIVIFLSSGSVRPVFGGNEAGRGVAVEMP
ncbi:MAG TPA: hypothetical protein VFE08_11245 [Candidatus Sulfotelmatobacter sp.]|nr:hypothetical protein [Candidatus Sulfotelmatobacter sp.]